MSHFAEIDSNGIVLRVLVVPDTEEANGQNYLANELGLGGTWIQTSFNNKIRGTFAGVGYEYNEQEDIFIAPQPFPSWTRVGSFWEAPSPYPNDGKSYSWNEETGSWNELS